MPELKSLKVRVEIEFEVSTSGTMASAAERAEECLTPLLKIDKGIPLGEPSIRSTKIVQIEVSR